MFSSKGSLILTLLSLPGNHAGPRTISIPIPSLNFTPVTTPVLFLSTLSQSVYPADILLFIQTLRALGSELEEPWIELQQVEVASPLPPLSKQHLAAAAIKISGGIVITKYNSNTMHIPSKSLIAPWEQCSQPRGCRLLQGSRKS